MSSFFTLFCGAFGFLQNDRRVKPPSTRRVIFLQPFHTLFNASAEFLLPNAMQLATAFSMARWRPGLGM
jgi:hypothetical protein